MCGHCVGRLITPRALESDVAVALRHHLAVHFDSAQPLSSQVQVSHAFISNKLHFYDKYKVSMRLECMLS